LEWHAPSVLIAGQTCEIEQDRELGIILGFWNKYVELGAQAAERFTLAQCVCEEIGKCCERSEKRTVILCLLM